MHRCVALFAVTWRNTQRTLPINLPHLQRTTDTVLRTLRLSDYSLNVWLTTDKTVREKNRLYRQIDQSTDILSFPFQILKPSETSIPPHERPLPPVIHDTKDLGEILISIPYVERQLKELNTTLDDRLKVLMVHGICHLLGYDHEEPEAAKQMEIEEQRLLKILKEEEEKESPEGQGKNEKRNKKGT